MPSDTIDLQDRAAEVARLLRRLSHEARLLVLCHLAEQGEATAGALVAQAGLSQSAVSQHLAMLREDGLVATRREGTTIHYRIADPRVARLLGALHDIFCS
jgi:ArsR family transcriptional regulator, virulence genes transcriptional regulator